MNKRIEQLAKQNGFIYDHMSVGERNDALIKFEKFAELIVRECADTANKWQTSEHPGLLVKDVILHQFGVEE